MARRIKECKTTLKLLKKNHFINKHINGSMLQNFSNPQYSTLTYYGMEFNIHNIADRYCNLINIV